MRGHHRAAGNTGLTTQQLSWWSGVVGVSAITTTGERASYVLGDGVTITATGGRLRRATMRRVLLRVTRGRALTRLLLSRFKDIALARQKWPGATSNQILQLACRNLSNHE